MLLGLTWLTGVGIVGEARVAMSYIFTILNAFLGFFIFLLHFALRHEVVDEVSRSVSIKRQSLSRTTSTKLSRTTSDANSLANSNSWQPIKSVVSAASAFSYKYSEADSDQSVDETTKVDLSSDSSGAGSPEKASPTKRAPPLGQLPPLNSEGDCHDSSDAGSHPGTTESESTSKPPSPEVDV